MNEVIDVVRWDKAIQSPDWYVQLWPEIKQVRDLPSGDKRREAVRDYFIDRLDRGQIALAATGDNLDAERQPVDTIVIHHTSNSQSYSLARLNAVHLLNLYVPYYINPTVPGEEHLEGQPLWSNHFSGGKQVFYAYHWMVRMDGTCERLLRDNQIGWQAGNWNINCRSVGICLDNDYAKSEPSPAVLAALTELIKQHYSGVPHENIIGHSEVVPGRTTCPGEMFASSWKHKVIDAL